MNNGITVDPDNVHGWLSQVFSKIDYPYVKSGINEDDCAVIEVDDTCLVITTDYLNANPIAKQLGLATFWDMGRLLVAANISDLLGSGAEPIAFLTSIMLEKSTSNSDFELLMNGVKYELDKHKIPLVGGDTKLGQSHSFCGTAIGKKRKNSTLFIKNKAEVKQIIWLSGNIGSVGAAVHGLSNSFMSEEWRIWAEDVLINPNLPVEKSRLLSISNLVSGGTDISDGFGENLYDLCESSKIGAIIHADKIPLDSHVYEIAKVFDIPAWFYAFSIGGDFQFLVTTPNDNPDIIREMGYFQVGYTTEESTLNLFVDGKYMILPRLGHTDFKTAGFVAELNEMVSTLKSQLL